MVFCQRKDEKELIIDMHTHIWPDAIAERTVEHLEKVGGITAFTDGTLTGLQQSMKEAGVTTSVILPVVTKPEQFQTVNQFAKKLNEIEGVLSFGGIHPRCEKIADKLEYIRELGLKGIKLHPDYQGAYLEEDAYITIMKEALSRNLIVLYHAGMDIAYPDDIHATPKNSRNVINQLKETFGTEKTWKLVLAHTGGYAMWDEVEKYLVGEPVYFDISFSMGKISDNQLCRIIRMHGEDRILFGTDSPWSCQKEMVEYVRRLPLEEQVKEKILYENARKLLEL